MLLTFVINVLILTMIVYIPGYLLLRGLHLPVVPAAVSSPLLSIAFYEFEVILFSILGLSANFTSVCLPYFVVSLFIYCIAKRNDKSSTSPSECFDICYIVEACLYLGFAFLTIMYVYISESGTLDFLIYGYDTVFHVNLISEFIKSGNYSSLDCSMYLPSDVTPLIGNGSGFYPAAWHMLGALATSLTSCSTAVAVNSLNVFIIVVLFPLSCWGLFRTLFAGRVGHIVAGAVLPPAFVVFPWNMLIRGEQYPQLLAFALVPAFVCILMHTTKSVMRRPLRTRSALICILISLSSLFALAMAQPNACFTAGVFIAFYWLGVIMKDVQNDPSCTSQLRRHRKSMAILGLFLVVATVWYLLYKSPFMQSVTQFDSWHPFASYSQALVNVLHVSLLPEMRPQPILASILFIGFVYALLSHAYTWLAGLGMFGSLLYVVCASCEGFLRHLLVGFWYTDPDRVASMLVLYFMPLLFIGLSVVIQAIHSIFDSLLSGLSCRTGKHQWNNIIIFICLLFCILVYSPNYESYGSGPKYTPFGSLKQHVTNLSSPDYPAILNSQERAFISRVNQLVDPGSLIINIPDDGSSFLFGVEGINTLYRRNFVSHDKRNDNESSDSKLIRLHLDDYAADPNVAAAVDRLSAQYVLILDKMTDESEQSVFHTYLHDDWVGIDSISENTPGFELLLSEGDMRLYKIIR